MRIGQRIHESNAKRAVRDFALKALKGAMSAVTFDQVSFFFQFVCDKKPPNDRRLCQVETNRAEVMQITFNCLNSIVLNASHSLLRPRLLNLQRRFTNEVGLDKGPSCTEDLWGEDLG